MKFPNFPEFYCSGDSCTSVAAMPSLNKKHLQVCILLEKGAAYPSERQLAVLESVRKLSSVELLKEIEIAALKYFQEVDAYVDLVDEGILIDANHLENHWEFLQVIIPRHCECEIGFAFIGMNCDWEEEDGMHILLSDGHVVYCGSCSTLYMGKGWLQVVSAEGRDASVSRLTTLLASIPR